MSLNLDSGIHWTKVSEDTHERFPLWTWSSQKYKRVLTNFSTHEQFLLKEKKGNVFHHLFTLCSVSHEIHAIVLEQMQGKPVVINKLINSHNCVIHSRQFSETPLSLLQMLHSVNIQELSDNITNYKYLSPLLTYEEFSVVTLFCNLHLKLEDSFISTSLLNVMFICHKRSHPFLVLLPC